MPKKNLIKKSALCPTVVIAGGAGFIGSHLCEVFLANGARVIVLDNFSTGKTLHIHHLLKNQNFALFDVDINNGLPAELASADYVIHLAGLEEYLFSRDVINLEALLTNSVGTKYLMDFAVKSNAKFLLVSSLDVYQGRMSQLDIKEYFGKTKLDESKYMLTEAKRYAEALVWEYHKKSGMDVRIVRLPEVYGPRMSLDASGSLGRYVKELIEGRSLTVFGDGSAVAYYTYIQDAVSGIVKSLFNENTAGNIYTLVDSKPITDLELAYLCRNMADREVRVETDVPTPTNEGHIPSPAKPDTFNLKDLSWAPRTSVKEGLVLTLQWFGYHPNEYSFKPAKLIAERLTQPAVVPDLPSASENHTEPDMLFSLQDVKQDTSKWEANASPILNTKLQTPDVPKQNRLPRIVKMRAPLVDKIVQLVRGNFLPLVLGLTLTFAALFVFIVLPFVTSYTQAKKGLKLMESAQQQAYVLNSAGLRDNLQNAYKAFYIAKKNLNATKWLFSITGKTTTFTSASKGLSSLAYFSRALYKMSGSLEPLGMLWEVARPDTAVELDAEAFKNAKLSINNAKDDLQIAQADYKYITASLLPQKYSADIKRYGDVMTTLAESMELAEPVLSYLPEVLGSAAPKRYLLLFQNNNEVRATGGFIGSYGVLSLDKGKIKSLEIDDVYNPDGQIDIRKVVVPAPDPIATYLKEKNMHVRNANWYPDFPTSAEGIKDLMFRVYGEQFDGVIAIDLTFVQDLLKVTSPLFITAYNEEITADNLYERAQFHSDYNYVDGSAQKKSFLTVLGSKLLERLFALQRDRLSALATALVTSLEERHLLIHLSNSPLNSLLSQRHWDGALITTSGDYLQIVNSNLGGTKANYYVKENYSYTVTSQTRDGLLRGIVTMEYKHTGQDAAWPGGPYTNYVRVLAQEGSKLTGATIKYNDRPTAEDILTKIAVGQEGKYAAFGYGFKLNPQAGVVVQIMYDLPVTLSITKTASDYGLVWQKQSGSAPIPFEYVFDKPFGMEIVAKSQGFVNDNDTLKLLDTFNVDKEFYVKLR